MKTETLDDYYKKVFDRYYQQIFNDYTSLLTKTPDKAHLFREMYNKLNYITVEFEKNRQSSVVLALIEKDYLLGFTLEAAVKNIRIEYPHGIPLSTSISILNKAWWKNYPNSDTHAYEEIGVADISEYTDKEIIKEFMRFKRWQMLYLELKKRSKFYLDNDGNELTENEMQDVRNILYEEIEVEEKLKKKEFTTARQVLAMHYIFKGLGIEVELGNYSAITRFIEFLTGKNKDRINDFVKSPLLKDGKGAIDDFRYVREKFEDLKYVGFEDLIKKDKKGL